MLKERNNSVSLLESLACFPDNEAMVLAITLIMATFVSGFAKANSPSLVTWGSQLEDNIFLIDGRITKSCYRKPICNNFLNELDADERSAKLLDWNYSKRCQLPEDDKESIHSLELSLRQDSHRWLGETNFFPSQCLSSTDNSFAAKKKLARYYHSMRRLAQTQQQVVQQLGLTQKMLGLEVMNAQSCDQFTFPNSVMSCLDLKKSCQKLNPQENEKQMQVMTEKSKNVLLEQAGLENELKTLRAQRDLLSKGSASSKQKADVEKVIQDKVSRLSEVTSKAPWVEGDNFRLAIGQRKTTREALQAQLKANIETFKQYLKDSEWAALCLKGLEKNCDYSRVRKIIEGSFASEPENTDTDEKKRLAEHYKYQTCLQTVAVQYQNTKDTVSSIAVDVGLLGLGLVTGGGTMGVAAERTLLRAVVGAKGAAQAGKVVKTFETGAGATHSFFEYQDMQEACRDMVGLKRIDTPHGQKCEIETLQESSSLMKNYTECLQQVKETFLASSVFSIGAFKNAFLARLKKPMGMADESPNPLSTVDWIKTHNRQVARRFDDYKGANARSFNHRVINGVQGEVSELEESLRSAPQLKPLGVDVVKSKTADGSETLHFREPLKLSDGTWVNTWPEFQIDKVTGFLDANYPGGRKLFETIAEKSNGKSYLGFIDLGNLGAINKFRNGAEDGDAYLKAVAKVILEKSNGRVTAARLGGDELGLIIHEADPEKAKLIMKDVIDAVRAPGSEARRVFDEQKKHLVRQAKDSETFQQLEDRQQQVIEFGKIQMPDLSMGLTKLTAGGSFADHLSDAEKIAAEMKVPNKLAVGMPASKYGSYQEPSSTNPLKQSYDVRVAPERKAVAASADVAGSESIPMPARDIQIKPSREIKRFSNMSLVEYKDESGQTSYWVEKYYYDPEKGKRIPIVRQIPTRGSDNLIDGSHPESQNLALSHFFTSLEPDRAMVMLKLRSLRYLNYFSSGTNTGDQMLSVVSQELKKELKRDSDLKMKLGGADYLLSVEHMKPEQVVSFEKRLQQAVQNHPVAREILRKESQTLTEKISEIDSRLKKEFDSKKKAELEKEAEALKTRFKQLKNFDFRLQVQSLRPDQVGEARDFSSLRRQLESQFPAD